MTMTFVFMKIKAGFLEHVLNILSEMEGVREAYPVTGGIDIIVKIEGESIETISKKILGEIHKIDGVERTATHIVVPL